MIYLNKFRDVYIIISRQNTTRAPFNMPLHHYVRNLIGYRDLRPLTWETNFVMSSKSAESLYVLCCCNMVHVNLWSSNANRHWIILKYGLLVMQQFELQKSECRLKHDCKLKRRHSYASMFVACCNIKQVHGKCSTHTITRVAPKWLKLRVLLTTHTRAHTSRLHARTFRALNNSQLALKPCPRMTNFGAPPKSHAHLYVLRTRNIHVQLLCATCTYVHVHVGVHVWSNVTATQVTHCFHIDYIALLRDVCIKVFNQSCMM